MIGIYWRIENESISSFRRALYLYLRPLQVRWPSFRKVYRTEVDRLSSFPVVVVARPLGRTRNEFATIARNDCPVIYSYAYIASSVSHVCTYIRRIFSEKMLQRAHMPRMRAMSKEN